MQNAITSPVPKEQIPLQEFAELTSSFFFSWPHKGNLIFFKNSFLSWLLSFPIFLFICTGSHSIKGDLTKFFMLSIISSLIVPIAIVIRQYLGWNYIYNRLLSDNILYEETDWHDGQIWGKPTLWIVKDNLIATHEVLPILSLIKKFTIFLLIMLLCSIFIFLVYVNIN